jgi:threonine dehydrogenase-like Zn-dependent dehydrogenase
VDVDGHDLGGPGPFQHAHGERSDGAAAIARAVGATRTVNASDADAIAAAEAGVVIECSGSPCRLALAVRGGRVVMVGLLPYGEQLVLISLAITRELELVGSFRFNDEIDAVLAALADGSLAVDPVVTHEFPATSAFAAFTMAQDASQSGKVLLDFST